MIVRDVVPVDHARIAAIVYAAFVAEFGRSEEGALIERLRAAGDVVLERVAVADGAIVGYVLFSRAWIEADGARHPAVQLGPVCAATGTQRSGVGSALIRDGLDALARAGESHVFVLGHKDYYPRFGFSPEAARAFDSAWPGPSFMLRRLSAAGPDRGRHIASRAFG